MKILFDAIAYCHDCQVVHRDLKVTGGADDVRVLERWDGWDHARLLSWWCVPWQPENLLLTDNTDDANIKIADFGFAQRLTGPNSLTTQCGTPG